MTEAKQEDAMAEARAEQRLRMRRMRNVFETRYKFVRHCGRGLNIEANTPEEAIEALTTD